MYANRETRGCDGRHGISTVLLSDGWILHCYPDGERWIEEGREDTKSTRVIKGRGE